METMGLVICVCGLEGLEGVESRGENKGIQRLWWIGHLSWLVFQCVRHGYRLGVVFFSLDLGLFFHGGQSPMYVLATLISGQPLHSP